VDNRFINLSQRSQTQESHPAWSPDRGALAWVSSVDGIRSIYLWEPGSERMSYTGTGDWPVWSPDGQALSTSLATPNKTYLTGYTARTAGLVLPPLALDGSLAGLSWGKASLPQPLPGPFAEAAASIPAPAWQPVLTPGEAAPADRQRLAPLADVQTGFAFLHDMVDESFIALRAQVSALAGWDFLGSLENAYVPLTEPLFPGMAEDWLYTGRAFNSAPVHAGWVVTVREVYFATYWRVPAHPLPGQEPGDAPSSPALELQFPHDRRCPRLRAGRCHAQSMPSWLLARFYPTGSQLWVGAPASPFPPGAQPTRPPV
jgi:TolB protein